MPEIAHKFEKTRKGQIHVKYQCPGCQTKLENQLAEAGARDACPDCGVGFVVPGLAKRKAVEAELKQKALQRREAELLRQKEATAEAERRKLAEAAKEAEEQAKRADVDHHVQNTAPVSSATAPPANAPGTRKPKSDPTAPTPQPIPVKPPPTPWNPPQTAETQPAATQLPQMSNTRYPALELYAKILYVLGWVVVSIGILTAGSVITTTLVASDTVQGEGSLFIGSIVSAIIAAFICLATSLLWSLVFFVAAEFIRLTLDARRDIAANVELTRLLVSQQATRSTN